MRVRFWGRDRSCGSRSRQQKDPPISAVWGASCDVLRAVTSCDVSDPSGDQQAAQSRL